MRPVQQKPDEDPPDPPAAPSLLGLPPDVADFTGRRAEMAALGEDMTGKQGAPEIAAVDGPAGIGKSALAVHLGRRLAPDYPAGQLLLDLAGSTDHPATAPEIMGRAILAFDGPAPLPGDQAALATRYNQLLAGRKALLIFDDARDADQLAPLLPLRPSGALITSQNPIALANVTSHTLGPLGPEEAFVLLGGIAGPDRASGEALSRIAHACGRGPLALRLAGCFLALDGDCRMEDYLAQLDEERRRLQALAIPDDHLAVAAALGPSLARLAETDAGRALDWRGLAVFAGDFEPGAAAYVWECAESRAGDRLGELSRRGLILDDTKAGRYRLHDLMRALACREAGPAIASAAARHAAYYRAVLARADDHLLGENEGMAAGLQLFERERANIQAGQRWAAEHWQSSNDAAGLCHEYSEAGVHILALRLSPPDHIAWLSLAAEAARRIANRQGETNALGNLGNAHARRGDARRAIELYGQALEVARETGDRRAEGGALGNLGTAHAGLGEARLAIGFLEQAQEVAGETGANKDQAKALGALGRAHAGLGEAGRAIEFHQRHLAIAREIEDRQGEAAALGDLGRAHTGLGQAGRAIGFLEQARELAREIGERNLEGQALGDLGRAHAELGEARQAIGFFEEHLAIAREIGERSLEGQALGDLGKLHAGLGDTERAIELHGQQLAIAWESADQKGEADALFRSALALRTLGATPEAMRRAETALEIYTEIGSPAAAEAVRARIEEWRD